MPYLTLQLRKSIWIMKMAKSQGFCEWCTELFSIELQNQRYIWYACNLNYIENNTKVKKNSATDSGKETWTHYVESA